MTAQKAAKAHEDMKEFPEIITNVQKQNMEDATYITLLPNISDNVLRQVIEESTSHEVGKKLHSLYDKKYLPNKIFIRERLFSFEMNSSKSLDENVDEFKKLINAFSQSSEKLGTESEAVILIN